MVARPLWNSAILGPLFLFSGLSAGAALIHLATATLPGRPAPQGLVGGALAALWQPMGREAPPRSTADQLTRADLAFLAIELVLIGSPARQSLHVDRLARRGGLAARQRALCRRLLGRASCCSASSSRSRCRDSSSGTAFRTPSCLRCFVLVGGFTLRWVMVRAGQLSHIVQAGVN